MNFKPGDMVRFLNDAGEGEVLEILSKSKVLVEIDGFSQEFHINQLVTTRKLSDYIINDKSVSHKINSERNNQEEQKLKQKFKHLESYGNQDQVVIDLHIQELTDSYQGMSDLQIKSIQISHFIKELNSAINKRSKKLIVIHGKGKGILKAEITKEMNENFPEYKFNDASFQEYGYNGATEIWLR